MQPQNPQSDPKIDRHAPSSTSHSPENPPPFRPPPPGITFSSRTDHSSVCDWTVPNFTQLKAKSLYSPYFQVGGYDFRILLYPRGDPLAVPGHISVYLQINCPKTSKLDCFAGYKITMVNSGNVSKSLSRESYNRFSAKRKSVGWGDFTASSSVLGKGSGFLLDGGLVVKADIRILNESVTVSGDSGEVASSMSGLCGFGTHVSNGKIVWKIHNYMLFKDMIKTYKILGPSFQVGESNLRMSVHRSVVGKVEYLALNLENNDTDKLSIVDRSCWCLFRISVLNQLGLDHVHRDSYGRFGVEFFGGDVSLGWSDYMKMSDFVEPGKGFLVDGTVVFSASFNAIKESNAVFTSGGVVGGKFHGVMKRCDGYMGKFLWKIENFSKLKDLLKKKKKVGLCVKGRRFQVGKQDFRLLVYPRGQSQKPCYLSIFLNVSNPKTLPASSSCFVHYRVSVINQRTKEKSITSESQNRCSKATRDWGWWEFMSLANLFDQDSGFILQDTVLFCAEVHVLKETFQMRSLSALGTIDSDSRPYLTWKLENFLYFKAIMGTGKIFSNSFQFGGCELRMGIYDSFGTLFMYLECDPSVEVDPDKNFWVKYRLGVVNQKDSAKSWWKESSICTSSCSSSDINFIRMADILDVENGFLVRDMVVFACEILDYCPWFDFPGLEFLDLDDDRRALSNDQTRRTDCRGHEVSTKDTIDIFNELFLRVFLDEGDPSEQLKKLIVRSDVGAVAYILTGLRFYLDDPAEMKHLKTEFSQTKSSQKSLVKLVKVLKHAINHVIFDIMVECCLPLEGRSVEDSYDGSSKPYPAPSACDCPSPRKSSPVESVHASIFEKLFYEVNNHTAMNAGQRSDVNATDTPRKQCIHLPEKYFENPLIHSIHSLKAKWPQPSKELLVLIVNSLKSLKGMVSEDCPEPKERAQLSDKISLLLDKAPKHLLPDLITVVVKLINHLEHPLVASTLLDHLQKHEVESTLQISVFAAIGQLDLSSEAWKQVLTRLYIYFLDSKEELLGATISLLFKAASRCQHISQAVRFVRAKLESLGANISSCLLDHLSRTIKGWSEIAETVISQIKSVFETGEKCVTDSCGPSCDEKEVESKILYSVDGWLPCADYHFLSVYCLIEMVSIPSLAVEAAQTFERGVAIGLIKDHLVAKVLERRHAQMLSIDQIRLAENDQRSNITGHGSMELCREEVEFHSVLHLAELLSLSKNSRVHGFVRFFYATLVRLYANDRYHRELLEGLVERVMNPAVSCCDSFLGIMTFLMQGENGIARLFVSMMREAADQAHVDREALWNRLRASKDENIQVKEEVQAELRNIKKQNASLLQRLSESEATVTLLKSEESLKEERFAQEKKELSKQIHKVTSQLERHLSERDDEIAKFSNEKKVCQDRICDLEKELVHLKSRKHDELKKADKEKNMLAYKLRKIEAERENFVAELKQSSMEAANYKSVQRSLLDEVGLLKQEVTQTKTEKQEMEEEVARCKARFIEMERTLNNCKQHISSLEVSLREEMLQHAPLYGVGLEDLSQSELETVSRIHEEGLREIHALQNGHQSSTSGAPGPMGNLPSRASSSQHIVQVGEMALNCTAIGRARPVR